MRVRAFALGAVLPTALLAGAIALALLSVLLPGTGAPGKLLEATGPMLTFALAAPAVAGCALGLWGLSSSLRRTGRLARDEIALAAAFAVALAAAAVSGPTVNLLWLVGMAAGARWLRANGHATGADLTVGLAAGGWPFLLLPRTAEWAVIPMVATIVPFNAWLMLTRTRQVDRWALLSQVVVVALGGFGATDPWRRIVACAAICSLVTTFALRWQTGGATAPRPSDPAWPSRRAVRRLASIGLVAIAVWESVVLLRYAPEIQPDGWETIVAVLGVGVALCVAGLRQASKAADWIAVAGAGVLCTAAFAAVSATWWLALPGFLVPWLGLGVRMAPGPRLALVPLQYLGMLPFFSSWLGDPVPTNLLLALGGVHLLAVWLVLPRTGKWRMAVRWSGAAATCAIVAVDVAASFSAVTPGRIVLGAAAAIFTAMLWVLGWSDVNRVQLVAAWRPRPAAPISVSTAPALARA